MQRQVHIGAVHRLVENAVPQHLMEMHAGSRPRPKWVGGIGGIDQPIAEWPMPPMPILDAMGIDVVKTADIQIVDGKVVFAK